MESLADRTDRALSRNTWFAAFVVAAQLLCLVDGPRSRWSFVHLAVMCALLTISLSCWLHDHARPVPRLLLVAWSSFVGVAVMAALDVLAFPAVYPEILSVNTWGIIALHDTLGRQHARMYAICTAGAVIVFGAVTRGPGFTALVTLGVLWFILRKQATQDEEATKTRGIANQARDGAERVQRELETARRT